MTGTALTEEKEFRDIYGMDVIEIPTNRPIARIDHQDAVYKTKKEKFKAVVEEVKEAHEKGQPVLVGTITIETSELISGMLKREGIPHTVLNAKFHEQEAEIVAQAGQHGAEDIPNLWNKFYKVDKARTREYGGSGIGLSIVKAIMEGLHQQYGVQNYDNGVEFWFTLDRKNQ